MLRDRKPLIHGLVLVVLALCAACAPATTVIPTHGSPLQPSETPFPSATPAPPTPTPLPPTPAMADLGLPFIHPGPPLSVENVDQLLELASWDSSALQSAQFVPGLDIIALTLPDRFVIYAPQGAAGTRVLAPPGGELPWLVPGFVLSPDGSLVAWLRGACPAESMRCQITVQPLDGGPLLLELETEILSALAFSGDSRYLLVGGSEGVAAYSLADGKLVTTLPGSLIFDRIGSSPDGSLLAGFIYMSDYVNVWRLPSGELAYRLQPQAYAGAFYPNNAIFSPDGQTLAVGANALIGLWKSADGVELRFWQPHNAEIGALAFSPDGALLVSSDWEGNLIISEVASGTVIQTFKAHQGLIWRVGFVAKGSLLVTIGADGKLRLWGLLAG